MAPVPSRRSVPPRSALPSRRAALLGAALAATAAACSGGKAEGAHAPPPSGPRSPTTTTATTGGPTAAAPTTTAPTTTTAPPVDPRAVAARHAGATPTQWGLDVTGVDHTVADPGAATAPTMALTFDACGGPGSDGVDTALLDLLEREQLPATLFLNARWVGANPAAVQRILAQPLWEVGNHGTRHLPLSVNGRSAYGIAGTRSADEVVDEVWANHEQLRRLTGAAPKWFRSGTAHYDEVATTIVAELGEQPVGFVVNGDAGATLSARAVTAALTTAPPTPGAVAIMHMIRPGGGTAPGLAAALPALRARGTRFVTLSGGGGAVP